VFDELRDMRGIFAILVMSSVSCGGGVPTKERLTLSSGRTIEVVRSGVVGLEGSRHYWFEYKTGARVPVPLLDEIREVWMDVQSDVERARVSVAFVEATALSRSVHWDGLKPILVAREKGCLSFTRQDTGQWQESALACCQMGPCEVGGVP
jgi:hypothetical protein